MARELFPFAEDREAIHAFLRGKVLARTTQQVASNLRLTQHTLTWRTAGGTDATIAWHADGTLYGKLLAGQAYFPGVHVIHAIVDILGTPDRRVTREAAGLGITVPVASINRWTHFFDGTLVAIDEPFVLAGPMSMRAFRAHPTNLTTVAGT